MSLGYVPWLAGSTFSDSTGRNQDVAAQAYLGASRGGVLQSDTGRYGVTAVSGMSVTVAGGTAVIPATSGDGSYRVYSPSPQTLTVATADPVNPRIDLVCVNVVDNGNNTSFAEVQIIAGVASSSPVAPSLPASGLTLATVAVGAGVTTITSGNVTDLRIYTTGPGGIIICPNMASLPAGAPGVIGYDVVNNRLFELTAAGQAPLSVLSFPPALAISNSNMAFAASTETLLLQTNFNSSGTDVMITGRFGWAYEGTGALRLHLRLYIDTTLVQDNQVFSSASIIGSNFQIGGQTITHVTSSLKGTTPSAAPHTAKFCVMPDSTTAYAGTISGSSTSPIELSVQQVSL